MDGGTRYLFLFGTLASADGGIQAFNRRLLHGYLEADPSNRAEVLVLGETSPPADLTVPAVKYHLFGSRFRPVAKARFIARAARAIGEHPTRVVCGHVNFAALVGHLCRRSKVPYVVMLHGSEAWRRLPPFTRRSLADAEALWTVSHFTETRCAEANAIDRAKFRLLPNAIDGRRFCPGPRSAALLDHWGLGDARILLTVARLDPTERGKGIDHTIEALPAIAAQYPNVRYVIVGRGDDERRLKKIAERCGVGDRVRFAGFVSAAELPDYYRIADVYVMPSWQEGFGIAYLEALATGIPVVAGSADASREPLRDGDLGWLVDGRDPAAIATACCEALAGKDRRTDGHWLRDETLAQFGVDKFAARVKALVRER